MVTVRHGQDDGVIDVGLKLLHRHNSIHVLCVFGREPWVKHINLAVMFLEHCQDVHDAGIAQVVAVSFKVKPITRIRVPSTCSRRKGIKSHLLLAACNTCSVLMPILLKIMASSLIRAMLRSRWVFLITLAA